MRAWFFLAALVTVPAWAGEDSREMNTVSKVWDRYAQASSQNQEEAASLLSEASKAHYFFLRDAALYASVEQMRRVPYPDRVLVYALRATQDLPQLQALADGAAVARLCTREGWCGVASTENADELPTLAHVTLMEPDEAIGELGPPTGTQFQFGPEFVREDGQWKVKPESLVADESAGIQAQIARTGMTENQMLQFLIGHLLGEKRVAPELMALERPLIDDAAARSRLNERWPDYKSTYRSRIKAIGVKADQGDSFAQFVLGSLLASGSLPEFVAKDEPRGWKMLEQASDAGNSEAAWYVFMNTMSDKTKYTDATLRRARVHLQRAASAAKPEAMNALGGFYFEGVGGLARDCRQAAQWQARAEEAGLAIARNEQVWTWATCPIPGQRDPAKAVQLASYMASTRDTLAASELDTVAAAYAAAGNFAEALVFQKLALDKLDSGTSEVDKQAVVPTRKRMQARLRGYGEGRDYVQDYNTFEEIMEGRY